MYRIYLSLVALFALGQSVWAGPIDRRQASVLAAKFVRLDSRAEAMRATELEQQGIMPAYHIFNDTDRSGFVILSGEEGLAPIIGYSESGQLQVGRLPEQLTELLRKYEQRIKDIRRSSQAAPGQSQSIVKYRPKAVVGPLLKCEWNQSTPYNDLAPKKTGEERAPIGCVATAMAQVMYFHQWPVAGRGKNTYTNTHYGELSADFSKSTYDWSNMATTYTRTRFGSPSWDAKAGAAVARLMYDAAVAVNMDFTPKESGAYTHDAARALDETFDYHVRFLNREMLNNEDFVTSVKDELNSKNPILMAGASDIGGHAWVIDGYDENGLIHVNWGWGGMSNGYFELDFMNPSALGIGGGGGNFNQGQEVILLRPRKADAILPERLQGRFSLFGDGMSIDQQSSDLPAGSAVFTIPEIGNMLMPKFKGEFGVGLYSPDGTLVGSFPSYALSQIPRLSYFTSPHSVSVYLTAAQRDLTGRYYFCPISREQRLISEAANPDVESSWEVVGEWLPMGHSNRIEVELNKGEITIITDGNTPRFVLTEAPEMLTTTWLGRKGSIRASIKNESFVTVRGRVALALETVGQTPALQDTLLMDETVFYDYTKVDRPLVFSTFMNRKLRAGKYKVALCVIKPEEKWLDENNKEYTDPEEIYSVENPFGSFEIEILDPSNSPVVEYYTSNSNTRYNLELFHDNELYHSDELTLEESKQGKWEIGISLRNYGLSFQAPVRYRLKDMTTGEMLELGTSPSIWMRSSIVPNTMTKVEINFGQLRLLAGRTYRILAEVKINNKWVDVWNAETPRRYLFVRKGEGAAGEGISGEGSDPSTPPNNTAVDRVSEVYPLVYPNPTDGALHVEVNTVARLDVYDMRGRRVATHEVAALGGEANLSYLPQGIYIAKIYQVNGQISIERLIVR